MGFDRVGLYVSTPLLLNAFTRKSDLEGLLVSPIMQIVKRNQF